MKLSPFTKKIISEIFSGDKTNEGIQGLPQMSPLEIFNKHSTLQHHPSQLSPTVAHEMIGSNIESIISPEKDRDRHESASTDRESEIRRIFDPGK